MKERIALRPFADTDMALFQKWLGAEHVAKWYAHPRAWMDEIEKRDGEYAWIRHLIAECGGVPIGFCQYYEYDRGGEAWHGDIDTAGAYSIDYLIGEADYLHKGYGKAMVEELAAAVCKLPGARRIIVQPEKGNAASRRTLLACGFFHDAGNDVFINPCNQA